MIPFVFVMWHCNYTYDENKWCLLLTTLLTWSPITFYKSGSIFRGDLQDFTRILGILYRWPEHGHDAVSHQQLKWQPQICTFYVFLAILIFSYLMATWGRLWYGRQTTDKSSTTSSVNSAVLWWWAACCLLTPSHELNQRWIVLWFSSEGKFT